MTKARLAAVPLALIVLTQCRFNSLLMPDRVEPGDVFVAEVATQGEASITDPKTPIACVALPDGWPAPSMSWSGTAGGVAVSGSGTPDAGETDFMSTEHPRPGSTWHCSLGVLDDYTGSDQGLVSHEITVPTSAGAARHELWFANGIVESGGRGGQAFGLRALAVGQDPELLDVWERATVSGGDDLFAVAYGPAGWLAVAHGSRVHRSPDGLSWSPGVMPSEQDWSGIAGSSERYVAVSRGAVVESTDGITWTPVSGTPPGGANAVAWADGRWVAVGDGGVIMRSEDGVAWTVSNSAGLGNLLDVAHLDGTWVVSGFDGSDTHFGTSTDGTTFVPGFIDDAELYNLGAGGGRFFLSDGDADSVNWYTSPDGVTWTLDSEPPAAVGYDGVDVDGELVAVGRAGSIWSDRAGELRLRTSRTGVILRGVHHQAGRVVAVGDGGTVFSSTLVPPPVLHSCEPADAAQGEPYTQDLGFDPGGGDHSWSIASGGLPDGVELVDGTLSGTPTVAGEFTFAVSIVDGKGDADQADCVLTVTGQGGEDTADTGDRDSGGAGVDPTVVDGCGCTTGGRQPASIAAILLLVLIRRRSTLVGEP